MAKEQIKNTETETIEAVEDVKEEVPKAKAKKAEKPRATLENTELIKKHLVKSYNEEEKVPVYLAPLYQPYFGRIMTVSISGVSIYFPVDGTTHKVPRTFAAEIERRRQAIDAILTKQGRMANIASNVETAPGELEFN